MPFVTGSLLSTFTWDLDLSVREEAFTLGPGGFHTTHCVSLASGSNGLVKFGGVSGAEVAGGVEVVGGSK